MIEVNSKVSNTTALAYIGDAVYEVYVRKYVMEHGPARVDKMNKQAISFVCADGQAKAARKLMEGFLTDEEVNLLKRGRNHTNTNKPRGSTPIAYKLATGFEALLGFLYLNGDKDRLDQVVAEAIKVIETRDTNE
jgi:ribonuclease-3 family protein